MKAMKLTLPVLVLLLTAACGEEGREAAVTEIEETGVIEDGDPEDENYGGYLYDSFEFHAEPLDQITVAIEAEGFQPIVTLHEMSTGAHIAEWDQEYSQDPCLSYRIAGAGAYEVRVHSTGGTGPYSVTIRIVGN